MLVHYRSSACVMGCLRSILPERPMLHYWTAMFATYLGNQLRSQSGDLHPRSIGARLVSSNREMRLLLVPGRVLHVPDSLPRRGDGSQRIPETQRTLRAVVCTLSHPFQSIPRLSSRRLPTFP
jgi:hypothetical protein